MSYSRRYNANRRIESQLLIVRSMPWDFVSATLEALVKKRQPISVPPEQLDTVATPIEKEKQMIWIGRNFREGFVPACRAR